MSIPVLIQVYDEMRRLAIAGSAVAAGDFRLKKLIQPLEKSGEKAPVFGKVAQAVQAVVDSNDKTTSAALLELTTLVNAILYTQGETGAAGELKPLETTDLGQQTTQAGARILKPLLEALSSTGSGRLELIRDAVEAGTFKDLRLVQPAVQAIDDPYPEIADLIVEKVLPHYGKAILPELRSKLDIKGRAGHLRRLQLIHRLDPEGSRDVIQSALNDGSKEMKVAAVECLGTSSDDLVYLLEQAQAKAKDVRAAALRALASAKVSNKEVVVALKKAIAGADLELFIARIRETSITEIQEYVLDQAEQQLKNLLATKDKKEQGNAVIRLQQLIACLEDRTDAKAEALLLKCFSNAEALSAIKSDPSGSDVNEQIARVLSRGTAKMQKELIATHKKLTGGTLLSAIRAARAMMPPADFYKEFSPLLQHAVVKRTKKNGAEVERAEALLKALAPNHYPDYYRPTTGHSRQWLHRSTTAATELDPRWLDAAVEAKEFNLVCTLARPNHPATNAFLSDRLGKLSDIQQLHLILGTMVRINHLGATDALIAAIKKQAEASSHYYVGYWLGRLIADLPKSALPKLEALLPTLPDKMVDQLMDSVIALKNKPE